MGFIISQGGVVDFPFVGRGRKYGLQMKYAPLENLGEHDGALLVTGHSS